MRVLRVEHKETEQGPYMHGWRTLGSRVMPCWFEDKESNEAVGDRQFGFASVKQLKQWFGAFPGDCIDLEMAGYHVVILDAPRSRISIARSQAVFPRKESKVIKAFPLARILK